MPEISRTINHNQAKLYLPTRIIGLGYLLALAFSEVFSILISPQAGLILYGIILLGLLLHASRSFRKSENRFLIILALIPIIRLLSLALPLYNFPPVYQFVIVGVPLSLTAFMCARFTGLKRNMIGLHIQAREIPSQLLIGLLGLGLGLFEYLILRPEQLSAEMGWDLIWLSIIILLVFSGFLEEVIFRGMLQSTATQHMGRIGVLYVAVLFAVLHTGYRSVLNVLYVFGVALLFGLIVQRCGTLLGVSISHGLTNVSLYFVFPFLFANTLGNNSPPVEILLQQISTPTPSPVISPIFEVAPKPDIPNPTSSPLEHSIQADSLLEPTRTIPAVATIEPTQCVPPLGWVDYVVQSGDTLWEISMRTGESVESLSAANCLKNSALIYTGQLLHVPRFIIEPKPTATINPIIYPTTTLTQTPKTPGAPSPFPTGPSPEPILETPRATPTLAPTTVLSRER